MVQTKLFSKQLVTTPVTNEVPIFQADGTMKSGTVAGSGSLTSFVAYVDLGTATDVVMEPVRPWQDETLNPGDLDRNVDVPRCLSVTTTHGGGPNMTGTVTYNGIDADGATIQEVITINDGVAPTTHITDRAFARVTSVVVDQTDVGILHIYSLGWVDEFGLPNYPFNAAGDVFKVSVGGFDSTGYGVNTTYGVVDATGIIGIGTQITFWYRPFKT